MTDSDKSKPDLADIERSFNKLDEALAAMRAGLANATGQIQQYIQALERQVETSPEGEQPTDFRRGFDAGRSTVVAILRDIVAWAVKSYMGEVPPDNASYAIASIVAKALNVNLYSILPAMKKPEGVHAVLYEVADWATRGWKGKVPVDQALAQIANIKVPLDSILTEGVMQEYKGEAVPRKWRKAVDSSESCPRYSLSLSGMTQLRVKWNPSENCWEVVFGKTYFIPKLHKESVQAAQAEAMRFASETARSALIDLNPYPPSWPPNYLVLPNADGVRFPSEVLRDVWKAGYKHCLNGGAFLDNPYPKATPADAQSGAEYPKRVLEIWDVMGTDCRLAHREELPASPTASLEQPKQEKSKPSVLPKPLVTARVEGELPDTASIVPDSSLQFLYKGQPATEKLPLTLWLDAVNIVEVSAADYRMDGLRVFSGDSEIMRRSSPGKDTVCTSATSLKLELSLRSDYLMDETSSDIQPGAEHPDQKKMPASALEEAGKKKKFRLRVRVYVRGYDTVGSLQAFVATTPWQNSHIEGTGLTKAEALERLRLNVLDAMGRDACTSIEDVDLEV